MMHVLVHCSDATCKYGFPIIHVSYCTWHPLNVLEFSGTLPCLPSDHVVQVHCEQCLRSRKMQPTSPLPLTDSCVFWTRRPFTHTLRQQRLCLNIIALNPCLIACYAKLCKVCSKISHTHTQIVLQALSLSLWY